MSEMKSARKPGEIVLASLPAPWCETVPAIVLGDGEAQAIVDYAVCAFTRRGPVTLEIDMDRLHGLPAPAATRERTAREDELFAIRVVRIITAHPTYGDLFALIDVIAQQERDGQCPRIGQMGALYQLRDKVRVIEGTRP